MWLRGGEVVRGELEVAEGWRRTSLDWRMSVSQGNIGASPGFFPLDVDASERSKLGIPADRMAVRPFLGDKKETAWKGGLRGHHVITAVNGESPAKGGRAFLVWFRQRHDPGEEIEFTVLEGKGEKKTVKYRVGRTYW